MPKRIANGLTLLSAVVCVGSLALVWRSFVWMDTAGKGNAYSAYTLDGRFACAGGRGFAVEGAAPG